jgi:hypothetical protein
MAPKTSNPGINTVFKYLQKNYNVPTLKDIDRIIARLDRIEKLIRLSMKNNQIRQEDPKRPIRGRDYKTAWEQVLGVIPLKGGVGVADIKWRTGFNEKKIRNIIFLLDKEGKIFRISRGVYVTKPY